MEDIWNSLRADAALHLTAACTLQYCEVKEEGTVWCGSRRTLQVKAAHSAYHHVTSILHTQAHKQCKTSNLSSLWDIPLCSVTLISYTISKLLTK